MGRLSGSLRSVSGRGAAMLTTATALMLLGGVTAQTSCVQVTAQNFDGTCPCDAGSDFTFTMAGETVISANTVNLAVIVDASYSVSTTDFDLSREFAKDAVEAFALENLFVNGGTASFAQFSSTASAGATFTSQADFDTFVDGDPKLGGGTNIPLGVARGRELLAAAPAATASFMIVMTDGNGGDPTDEADAARAEGTIVLAVGVGSAPSQATLLAIAGDESNVFDVTNFSELNAALADILSVAGGTNSVIPCPSTDATITIEFNAVVVSASVDDALSSAVVGGDGTSVLFDVADLEDNSVSFSVVLDHCAETSGTDVVSSISYGDSAGNVPDLTTLSGTVPTCDDSSGGPCGADVICDDPHMHGLRGQSIDWSGVDGGWYSLVKDDDADYHINVRLTAPLPEEFPNRQLITGVAIISNGDSLVIEVKNPYTIDTDGCPDGVSPCLANGGLRAVVNGEEVDDVLRFSRHVDVADGMIQLSGSNLPVECRQFGGDRIWARMYEEMLQGKRRLMVDDVSLEDWILSFRKMAAHDWCTKYIAENDLADLQSTHAIFKVETPAGTVRINAGVNHQGQGDLDWDGRVLPDLDFWQMDIGLEGLDISNPTLSGILGETARPVYDENGRPVMNGFGAFRGDVEDYRVLGPVGTHFALLDLNKDGHE